jgi:hypothetical protein
MPAIISRITGIARCTACKANALRARGPFRDVNYTSPIRTAKSFYTVAGETQRKAPVDGGSGGNLQNPSFWVDYGPTMTPPGFEF